MTASPNFAPDARDDAEAASPAAPAAGTAPFVLNLCSSTTPMALAQTELPELRRFTFFVSRRFEEGRERFRLHMGYFATLAEAEEWLSVVREIYPGAWAGEAPGRKLRERAVAAVAAQAQHAAGPQPHAAAAAVSPRPSAPPPAAGPPLRVPVVHAAPPLLKPAPAAAALRAAAVNPPPAALRSPAPPTLRQPPLAPAAPKALPAAGSAVARAAAAVPRAARPAKAARPAVRPVFEDSNVREVLKALGEASGAGETRLMHAPPPPRREEPADPLSDTQVLRFLEARRTEGNETPPAELAAAAGAIPLLKPDDTGTRRALKEAVVRNAPVSFAVQLQWSVQAVELDNVPPLAIFSAYTLYTVEGSRDGRKWYGLRLGFFSDAISAKQVAHYVRSEFAAVAVVPVSPLERARATDQEYAATRAAPVAVGGAPTDEFKLLDDTDSPAVPTRPTPPPAKPASQPLARTAATRGPREGTTQRARVRGGGKVGARDRRGPHTLEETLEILGASELTIETGNGETINDSGVRHLRVEVHKNSPFSRLLERLSERMKKP